MRRAAPGAGRVSPEDPTGDTSRRHVSASEPFAGAVRVVVGVPGGVRGRAEHVRQRRHSSKEEAVPAGQSLPLPLSLLPPIRMMKKNPNPNLETQYRPGILDVEGRDSVISRSF